MTESLPIDGRSLALEPFLSVVRGRSTVSLTAEARAEIQASRAVVDAAVRRGRAIYGVTTGFGQLSDKIVQAAQAKELQLSLVRSHASGAGEPLPEEVVRGLVLVRANSLARGHSGVRPVVVETLLAVLNRGLYPYVPTQGSVGASGDLAPLAHVALALIGEGEFVGPHGARLPAAAVLVDHGIAPLELAEKEGVALVNGTSLMASYLSLAVADSLELFDTALVAAALSFDALEGNPEALDDRLGELRNFPEQRAVATAMRQLLVGSTLSAARPEYRGQDPYTLRCIPQVLGATRLAIDLARRVAEGELNAVSDNPVVFPPDEFVGGGNFHGENLAFALDTLAVGLAPLAAFSERRIARLVHPALNRGLPAFLAPTPGLSSGFMIPQYLAAALVNENVSYAHPASAASLPTSADQEDFVSMGAWAGAKLRRLVTNARTVLAIELLVAAQALELRRPKSGGRGSEAALRAVRELVAPWAADRPPAPEIERLAGAIGDGSLVRKVRAVAPF
ncbi:MAG: histidine ammonia-lyase [Thermoplasmata archaeon]|nr:histidine ammonia-lyase [Thermoplasmata archaeon]MCI4361660.1 histidine ammonia-lyase [Thermoplasmata archaeon]